MGNEDDYNYYSLVDQYGRVNNDGTRRYVDLPDIETSNLIRDRKIDTLQNMQEELRRQASLSLIDAAAAQIHAYGNEHSIKATISKKPDCVLDDVLLNLKRGLKPYYQERLDYYIGEVDSNKGCYIEYEPGVELLPSQKVEWLLTKTVEKINVLYESKKKAYLEKIEAEKIYKEKIQSLEKSIKNYQTKGHDLLI
jgi:hypothetical protein